MAGADIEDLTELPINLSDYSSYYDQIRSTLNTFDYVTLYRNHVITKTVLDSINEYLSILSESTDKMKRKCCIKFMRISEIENDQIWEFIQKKYDAIPFRDSKVIGEDLDFGHLNIEPFTNIDDTSVSLWMIKREINNLQTKLDRISYDPETGIIHQFFEWDEEHISLISQEFGNLDVKEPRTILLIHPDTSNNKEQSLLKTLKRHIEILSERYETNYILFNASKIETHQFKIVLDIVFIQSFLNQMVKQLLEESNG